ncbi:MAG: phytase [Rhodospirillaceae bacterium]|nr:phytase [Rhodospirillaceae bacterium]
MTHTAARRTARDLAAVLIAAAVLAGCEQEGPLPAKTPTVAVAAVAETAPVPNADDAADDPAIWVDAADPARSVIIGTNKKGGLEIYDLTGARLSVRADGRINNVDIRQDVAFGDRRLDIVAATNRTDKTIALYRFDGATRELRPLAPAIPSGLADPYGLCLYRSAADGALYVFANDGEGPGGMAQWRIAVDAADAVTAAEVRRFTVGSQAEGCVADDAAGVLFVGEEDVGVWRYGAEPAAGDARTAVDTTGPQGNLVADVEGMSIFDDRQSGGEGGGGYLIVSSQGSYSYNVYDRRAPHAFRGAFAIIDGAVDGVQETDGLDVSSAVLPAPFEAGLLVVQDGDNTNPAANQNFKLVPWAAVKAALKLE